MNPHPHSSSSLVSQAPAIALGSSSFGNFDQSSPSPEEAVFRVRDMVLKAFDSGVRTVDTSPFYGASEQLLGQALSCTAVTNKYGRSEYVLMTKVGRIASDHWDYSPAWVRQSVERSLQRLRTSYLDVVFCHDIESVTDEDVSAAVGELLNFVQQGKIRSLGLSSYRIDLLAHRTRLVRERFGRPVIDVIQNWGQLNLQNARLASASDGLEAFRDAGVSCVFSSSPLVMGLLRRGAVPTVGNSQHPAPEKLREATQDAARWVEAQGESLASLALRDAIRRAQECSRKWSPLRVCTIFGASNVAELDENLEAARKILQGERNDELRMNDLNITQVQADSVLVKQVRRMLGDWVDWSFTFPSFEAGVKT